MNPHPMNAEQRAEAIYKEIGALARFVEHAMKTVAEIGRPVAESSLELPTVTSHLTDLVKMTEEGAMEVMRLTELMQEDRATVTRECRAIAGDLRAIGQGDLAGRVEQVLAILNQDERRLTDIMTALSFQDLAAQRVKKLVAILEDVREKLVKLVVVLGDKPNGNGGRLEGRVGELLKELGQSRDSAMKQRVADEILAKFGFE
ncbi:MAG: protein phosphatase CheZ [Nitrospira sp.]|nr:protein phosphatase CheZ [Nitrospira sp.]